LNIAEKYGLYVVEDAAQAHGAQYKNNGSYKKAGTFAHIAAFSFYPSKNLGAYGNGGAVVTDDESLEKKVRMLVDHGQSKKYYHNVLGWNFKMNGFQGAILSEKLKYLDGWNDARRQNAMRYELAFEGIEEVILPREAELCKHVYHLFVVRTKERKEFQDYLKSKGIGTGIHYPIPLHLQEAYGHLGYQEGDFPVAEKLAHEVVSLPMFPELHDEEIEYVGRKAREYFTQAG
jgi:dTDP-4-amino-4,6-dideoxygalactose transaminase